MDPISYVATGVLGVVGLGIGAFFRFGPGRRLGAMADAMLGIPDVTDRRGGVMTKGSPGLVDRVSTLEDAVKILVNQDTRISAVEARVSEHDAAIAALIATTFEKGAGHALAAEEMKQRGVVDGEVE